MRSPVEGWIQITRMTFEPAYEMHLPRSQIENMSLINKQISFFTLLRYCDAVNNNENITISLCKKTSFLQFAKYTDNHFL